MNAHDTAQLYLKVTTKMLNISPEGIFSQSRKQDTHLFPRQVIQAALKLTTNLSLASIGQVTGRDHATILNTVKQVNTLMEVDRAFRNRFGPVMERLTTSTIEQLENYVDPPCQDKIMAQLHRLDKERGRLLKTLEQISV
jgi:hypothetical protein